MAPTLPDDEFDKVECWLKGTAGNDFGYFLTVYLYERPFSPIGPMPFSLLCAYRHFGLCFPRHRWWCEMTRQ